MRKISDIDCDNLFKSIDNETKYQRMKRMAEWYEQRYFEVREELIALKLKLEIINKLSNTSENDIATIKATEYDNDCEYDERTFYRIGEQGGET